LTADDKPFARLGTAVLDRNRCIAWEQNKMCVVCDEVCPYNAIEAKMLETPKGLFKVPVVYEELCTGCGICEHHCPVFDTAAIVIYKFGENRRSSGPYVSDLDRELIYKRRRQSDSGGQFKADSTAGGGGATPGITPEGTVNDSKVSGSSGLPPGFETGGQGSGSGGSGSSGLPPGFSE